MNQVPNLCCKFATRFAQTWLPKSHGLLKNQPVRTPKKEAIYNSHRMRRESLPFSYSEMSFIMSNPVRRMPRARPRPPSSSEDRGQSVNERHFKNTRPASGFKNPGSTCRRRRRRRRAPPRGSWTNATGLTADRGRPLLVTQIKRGPENHREILR